jgi:L-rhamnose mutarotase
MKRYGQVVRLKPESRDDYLRYHKTVWPGVLRTIAECNIRNCSIFEHGELLFAYFEYHGSDFAAGMAKITACPEIQCWCALMFPLLEKLPPKYKENDGQISPKFLISAERHERSRNWSKPNPRRLFVVFSQGKPLLATFMRPQ